MRGKSKAFLKAKNILLKLCHCESQKHVQCIYIRCVQLVDVVESKYKRKHVFSIQHVLEKAENMRILNNNTLYRDRLSVLKFVRWVFIFTGCYIDYIHLGHPTFGFNALRPLKGLLCYVPSFHIS